MSRDGPSNKQVCLGYAWSRGAPCMKPVCKGMASSEEWLPVVNRPGMDSE